MSRIDDACAFIAERGELRAGKPGHGPAASLAGFLGVTPQRARLILLELEEAGRITIEPPRDPHHRGPGRIERVTVTSRPDVVERKGVAMSGVKVELHHGLHSEQGGCDLRRIATLPVVPRVGDYVDVGRDCGYSMAVQSVSLAAAEDLDEGRPSVVVVLHPRGLGGFTEGFETVAGRLLAAGWEWVDGWPEQENAT